MKQSITELSKVVASNFMGRLIDSLEKAEDISLLIEEMETFLLRTGNEAMARLLEEADAMVREAPERVREWEVQESACNATLATIFGEVQYARTYYRTKGGDKKKYAFLSDKMLGIEAHDKTEALLDARMVEEAVDLAYRKSGKKASRPLEFTGQTVMNKIRELGAELKAPIEVKEKKRVAVLYIEADEDHVALQSGGTVEPRLVYVHEGKRLATQEWPKNGRARFELVGKRCFGGVYEEHEELWLEVADYIDQTYDTDSIQRIYLSGDGARWIRNGTGWIDKSVYVVDKYHLSKYVKRAGAHIENGEDSIWEAIKGEDREYFDVVMDTLVGETDNPNKVKEINEAKRYIEGVWETLKYHKEADYIGCSAEGHISHILSARLSSRPLGWSRTGADQMARLRVFRENGGNIHRLMLSKKDQNRFEIKIKNQDDRIKQMRKQAAGSELQHNLEVINVGKVTGLNNALKGIRGLI